MRRFVAFFVGALAFESFVWAQAQVGATAGRASIASLPEPSKRFALIIGVEQYTDQALSKLDGPSNDARMIKESLIQFAGFPDNQIFLLASDQEPELRPTRPHILRRLSKLKSLVPPDGLLLVSFSGHGIEQAGEAFLLPEDAQVESDVDLLRSTALAVDELTRHIRLVGAKQVIVLMDACRDDPQQAQAMGVATPSKMSEAYVKPLLDFDTKNSGIDAFATIYATSVGERAYIYKAKRQGYFSWALVDGVMGAAKTAKSEVTLGSLIKHLQATVPKMVSNHLGKTQKPYALIGGYKADELVLASSNSLALEAGNKFAYTISARLSGVGSVAKPFTRKFVSNTVESCKMTGEKTVSFCLNQAESVERWLEPEVKALSCSANSQVVFSTRRQSENPKCVTIGYQILGCADKLKPGCDTSGPLGFEIDVVGTSVEDVSLPDQTWEIKTNSGNQLRDSFLYSQPIPEGVREVRWNYQVFVMRQVGLDLFTASLTQASPEVKGIASTVTPSGHLIVDMAGAMKVWRRLEEP